MDITVDSPNLEERDLYAYWHSPFSPYSVLTAIKDLYPTWTTGKVFFSFQFSHPLGLTLSNKVQDFSAKSGSYNAPYLTENQADTLSGVFDATFLEYPTKEKAKELFKNAVEIVPSAAEVISIEHNKTPISMIRHFHLVHMLATGDHTKLSSPSRTTRTGTLRRC